MQTHYNYGIHCFQCTANVYCFIPQVTEHSVEAYYGNAVIISSLPLILRVREHLSDDVL